MESRFTALPHESGWEITDALFPEDKIIVEGDVSALVRVTRMLAAAELLITLKQIGY